MKAIVTTRYGAPEVLELRDLPKPAPKDDEILIKVHASTVTAGDCEMRRSDFPAWLWLPLRLYMGVFKPRVNILGQELSGEVEAVGKSVTRFKPGDLVFAPTDMNLGAHAEYHRLKAKRPISLIPNNMNAGEAATIPTGGLNALFLWKMIDMQLGQRLLVNGAGGSIGTYAVQIAKADGVQVDAVDHGSKLDMLRSIGADDVIDYEQEDFADRGEVYDVVLDIACKERSFSKGFRCLKPGGIYISANPSPSEMIRGWWKHKKTGKHYKTGVAPYKQEDLEEIKTLIEEGKVKAVIDRRFPLEDMAGAHRYVETGRKAGNVVITINSET